MQLTNTLYRYGVLFFAAFLGIVFWGFWNSYYSNPFETTRRLLVHLHAAVMTLWCLMLVLQAYLVRRKSFELHRKIGRLSYVMAPIIVVLLIAIAGTGVPAFPFFAVEGVITPFGYIFLVDAVLISMLFALFYALAMANRRTPPIHARYMVCTTFPLLAPATDRGIEQYFPSLYARLPTIAGETWAPFVPWVVFDVSLIVLSVFDWRSKRRTHAFPIALGIVLVYEILSVNAYRIAPLRMFAEWFSGLSAS